MSEKGPAEDTVGWGWKWKIAEMVSLSGFQDLFQNSLVRYSTKTKQNKPKKENNAHPKPETQILFQQFLVFKETF